MKLSKLPLSVTRKNVSTRTKTALNTLLKTTFMAAQVFPAMFSSWALSCWSATSMLSIIVCWSIPSSALCIYGVSLSAKGTFSKDLPSIILIIMSSACLAISRSCSATIGTSLEIKNPTMNKSTR